MAPICIRPSRGKLCYFSLFSTQALLALRCTRPLSTAPAPAPIRIFRKSSPLRTHRRSLLLSDRTVGLVPTMGALHSGHLSLARLAARENTDVFISIYVNPTQFGLNEDLASYPTTWDADIAALSALDAELSAEPGMGRISAIFAPTTKVMYPTLPPSSELPGLGSFVTITPLANYLEGSSRPVFFRGVATVCTKLFNIVQPERVYFGAKDIQQTIVVKRLVKDLHIPTTVRVGPTMREPDGLAMSSRNVNLGTRRRSVAVVLSQALRLAEQQCKSGKTSRGDILWPANDLMNQRMRQQEELPASQRAKFEVDYISLADPETLEEVEMVEEGRGAILSGAIKMLPVEEARPGEDVGASGGVVPVRLIDNVVLEPAP